MAGKTTNLQLQKIDNTDYAGDFPTIYNNNLDLIDQKIDNNEGWRTMTDVSWFVDIVRFIIDESQSIKELIILKRFRVKCSANYNGRYVYGVSGIFEKSRWKCPIDGEVIVTTSNSTSIDYSTSKSVYVDLNLNTNRTYGSYNASLEINAASLLVRIAMGNTGTYTCHIDSPNGMLVTDYPHFINNKTSKIYFMIEFQD